LKKNIFKVFLFLFAIFDLEAFQNDPEKKIRIKSERVEVNNDFENVNFIDNVFINSQYVKISANSAIYNNNNKTISILGDPSSIESIKDENVYEGAAEKIIFFNDEKVHLIGNASMKLENISIASNLIIFNTRTGKITSN
jgi:lipopolysaccharide transport protein LptA